MRIALENLGSDRLDLDLGNGRVVELAELKTVGGTVERSGPIMQLRGVGAAGALLGQLSLPLPTGKLSTTSPATLTGLELNVDIRADKTAHDVPGFAGSILGAGLEGTKVNLELAVGKGTLKVTGDLAGKDISVLIGRGTGEVKVASLGLRNVQLMISGAVIRADRLVVSNLAVSWGGDGGLRLGVDAAELANLHVKRDGIDLRLGSLALPDGFGLGDKQVDISAIIADDIEAILAELVKAKQSPTPAGAPPAPPRQPLVDLSLLDRLNGRINIDVTLVAVVPVIGSRDATHKFRIPVSNGVINYAELEDDLSALEDAFIDFAVRGGRLVIERDVPIIPGLNKPIVIWELDNDELDLAKRKLVRLRTLPRATLAKSSEDDGKSSFELKRLRVDNVDVELSLGERHADAPAATTSLRELSVGKLMVGGLIDHMPHTELDPTPVEIDVEAIGATIDDLAIGKLQLGATVEVGRIKGATVTMHGLKPGGLSGSVAGVRVTGLRVVLP